MPNCIYSALLLPQGNISFQGWLFQIAVLFLSLSFCPSPCLVLPPLLNLTLLGSCWRLFWVESLHVGTKNTSINAVLLYMRSCIAVKSVPIYSRLYVQLEFAQLVSENKIYLFLWFAVRCLFQNHVLQRSGHLRYSTCSLQPRQALQLVFLKKKTSFIVCI